MQIENKKVRGCMILEVLHKHTANSVAYIKEVLMRLVPFPYMFGKFEEIISLIIGSSLNTNCQLAMYEISKIDFLDILQGFCSSHHTYAVVFHGQITNIIIYFLPSEWNKQFILFCMIS